MAAQKELAEMRLDKWLKMVRIYKKREEASEACNLGRVKVNDVAAKAGRLIKVGDKVLVKQGKMYHDLTINALPIRGLSAKDAKDFYDEKVEELSEDAKLLIELDKEAEKQSKRKYKGRPTKKERRDWSKFNGF